MDFHKFFLHGTYVLLDVNSGAVHVVDKLVYDVLDFFQGDNDEEVLAQLQTVYSREDLTEAMAELRGLIAQGQLFSSAPEISPAMFQAEPIVKALCLHVAHDCNLRCRYCFAGTGDFGHARGLMTPEVGEKAVDFILAHSGSRKHCEIDFFGGEPLLNMDTVRHVVKYIRQKEALTGKVFKLTLTTNAVLLDPKRYNI